MARLPAQGAWPTSIDRELARSLGFRGTMLLSKIASAVAVTVLVAGVSAESASAGVPKIQRDGFAALRHAPSTSVPAEVKRFASSRAAAGFGIDVSETRRVAAPDGGSWDVLSGAAGICMFDETEQTGTCASTPTHSPAD